MKFKEQYQRVELFSDREFDWFNGSAVPGAEQGITVDFLLTKLINPLYRICIDYKSTEHRPMFRFVFWFGQIGNAKIPVCPRLSTLWQRLLRELKYSIWLPDHFWNRYIFSMVYADARYSVLEIKLSYWFTNIALKFCRFKALIYKVGNRRCRIQIQIVNIGQWFVLADASVFLKRKCHISIVLKSKLLRPNISWIYWSIRMGVP